jgi:hypothetical protein
MFDSFSFLYSCLKTNFSFLLLLFACDDNNKKKERERESVHTRKK